MATYPGTPIENLNVFNTLNYTISDNPLTQSEADLLYLKFPTAQGTETFQATINNGTATFNNDIIQSNSELNNITQSTITTLNNHNVLRSCDIYGNLYLLKAGVSAGPEIRFNDTQGTGTQSQIYHTGTSLAFNNLATSGNQLFGCKDGTGTNVNALILSSSDMTITTTNPPTCSAVQPASTDSSTKIPTTAWVQSAVGLKNMWSFSIFNNNTNIGTNGTQTARIAVPYNANNSFSNAVRVEVCFSVFINSVNSATPQAGLIPAVSGGANPNTISYLDLIYDSASSSYYPFICQSTFGNILVNNTYTPPNTGVALNYIPIQVSTLINNPVGFNTINITINCPRVNYLTTNYQGNLIAFNSSVRIVSSRTTTSSTPTISSGASSGVAYFY